MTYFAYLLPILLLTVRSNFIFSYCPYTDEKVELPCELGYFSVGNASTCEICPRGYECPFQDQDIRYSVIRVSHWLKPERSGKEISHAGEARSWYTSGL